eukprot:gene14554-14677_t
MTDTRVFLSKSKITAFEQCPRRLWLETHRKDLIAYDDARQAVFQTGHEVGAIAQQLHPGGVLIGHDDQLSLALEQTSELLFQADRRPLFEATFAYEDVLVRVDLLLPEADGWRICEVKSTASVKPYHLGDLATQVWVAVGAGLTVSRACVQHIDSRFRYDALGDYRGLFAEADRTQAIVPLVNSRQGVVSAAKAVVRGAEPDIATGPHCAAPFSCPFIAHCGKDDPPPPAYPVELLPGQAGKRVAAELKASGFDDLRDVPAAVPLDGRLRRILDATRSGEAYLDAPGVRAELSGWAWPRYYFDFETVSFAVPRWLGTRPFENVPFQFSCHTVHEDGAMAHDGFLDLSGDDPARACAEKILSVIGSVGAVVTYSAGFERSCLRGLAARFPDLAPRLLDIAERLVDLLPVVQEHYYHRDMKGSYSIKDVLPARLPELSYKALDGVADGRAAQEAYKEAVRPATTPERRDALGRQLWDYCALDTLAMVRLAQSLSEGDGAE